MEDSRGGAFTWVMLAIFTLYVAFAVVALVNPLGWGQRILWGERPPYHWSRNGESLIGANGKECAHLYLSLSGSYMVYGYGFDGDYKTRVQAESKAARECR